MSKTLERRAKQLEDLIVAAEKAIASKGLTGLKSRELASEIGVANGAVFNLVDDMDELILRVGSRTRTCRASRPSTSSTSARRRRSRRRRSASSPTGATLHEPSPSS